MFKSFTTITPSSTTVAENTQKKPWSDVGLQFDATVSDNDSHFINPLKCSGVE